jgi:hypothetical protein
MELTIMTAITITISSPSRAIVAEGRLVAGETAEVSIEGVAPSALYLVAPDQTVVAACEAFTPKGQGTGGVGFLQLATEQIAALFANTPAGRMIAVWALINGADGVAGAGWVPVLSAPMPDELVDLDIDFYLRASQVGAGLAIVDGKLVCTVNPATYLTKAEAAQTYATQTALAGKQDTISDLATIRAGAAAGASAVQSVNGETPGVLGDVEVVASLILSQVYNLSVEAVLQLLDVTKANAADLRYALGETITASAQLADRAGNRVVPLDTNTENIVLTFPSAVEGHLRDFLVLVTNTAGNTGGITFTPPTGATVYGDGFTNSPASGETWLYSITEVAADTFWVKSVKMEVAQ